MSDDLRFTTIAAASAALRTRRISPVELTEAFLARIAALDDRLHSYILVLGETARAEAKAAEAEIAAGRWRGPLHDIPIALKDIYNTAGVATTGHSALFRDHVPTTDATTVRKLREAGAVVLGKASTWEFAIGGSSFDLPWPPAHNPWDLERDPSGSSSGSAAAVAAGLAMGAMGSDTGGSIRGPPAWCGIAGHKPTYGLVSRAGVLPLSFAGPRRADVLDGRGLRADAGRAGRARPARPREFRRDSRAVLRRHGRRYGWRAHRRRAAFL